MKLSFYRLLFFRVDRTLFTSSLLLSVDFIQHCFFGRDFSCELGGVSRGVYQSLNVSYTVGDNSNNVDINRSIIAKQFNLESQNLISLKQVHSTNIQAITKENKNHNWSVCEADGLISEEKNIILGVTTADCLPILMVDTNNKIISAIHCGWQGLLNGIIENNIKQHQKLAKKNTNLLVAIGPCIKKTSYEVNVDFYNNFCNKDLNVKKFFIQNKSNSDKFLFDLSGYARFKLEQMGVKKENIDILQNDTFAEQENFFSHRRMITNKEEQKGLQISCIAFNNINLGDKI